jgi:hypothetical protein
LGCGAGAVKLEAQPVSSITGIASIHQRDTRPLRPCALGFDDLCITPGAVGTGHAFNFKIVFSTLFLLGAVAPVLGLPASTEADQDEDEG